MNFNVKKVGLLVAVMALGFTSCSKEEANVTPELTQAEVKEIIQENLITEDLVGVLGKGFKIASRGADIQEKSSSCFFKNFLSLGDDKKTLTLDFGSGCKSFLTGKELAGKLTIKYSLLDKGYNRSVSFKDFSIGGIKLQGNLFVENTLKNANGNPHSQFKGDFMITLPSGKVISRKGSWKSEVVKGADTPLNLLDNEYATTGSWESLSLDGFKRSITITKPLTRKSIFKCGFFSTGTIELVRADKKYTLNFAGNNENKCTDKLTLTKPDGSNKDFSLAALFNGKK